VHLAGDGDEAGIEFVRSLSRTEEAPAFVLATASQGHAIEAFELGVVDYLRKPFTQDRVSQCLQRVRARRPPSTMPALATPRIVARKKRSLVFLRPEEVWAFEAADRLASVHTTYGTFEIDLSLTAIEASVARTFLRVHRNWLVNLEHVREIVRDEGESILVVSAGLGAEKPALRVPVARERAQAVRDLLLANATGVRKA
jgi:DNA-binding LytR/AlgR family response regulator